MSLSKQHHYAASSTSLQDALRQTRKEGNHILKKRFGQHFLTDSTVLTQIVNTICPQANDVMLEIGPGLGAMTYQLLHYLPHLYVVEIDRDFVQHLRTSVAAHRLHIYATDALHFDIGVIPCASNQRLRIVGNLPYNISTPLLFHLFPHAAYIQDQHFMLQKEVVERMVAPPGNKIFGRLSVMLQWRYDMEMLMTVPPNAFSPPPKVDSAVVRMRPIAHPLPCDADMLSHIVKKAFSQRRKIIRNSLADIFSEKELILANIDPQARPESLSVEKFVGLATQCLQKNKVNK